MSNQNVEICVNGKPIRKFSYEGKLFVEARKGQEYSIKIKNNDSQRILVVGSVDGINILDGQPAGKSKAGYVINGYQSYEIKGFRKSSDAVNTFRFNSKDKSYAAKSKVTQGDTSNCGVIAVVIYSEKENPKPKIIWRDRIVKEKEYVPIDRPVPYPAPYPIYPKYPWRYPDFICRSESSTTDFSNGYNGNITRCLSNNISNSTSNSIISNGAGISQVFEGQHQSHEHITNFDMGTEWSKNEINDTVINVEIELGKKLTTFIIYYASRSALIDMGIDFNKTTKISFPNPFPSRFCQPPED